MLQSEGKRTIDSVQHSGLLTLTIRLLLWTFVAFYAKEIAVFVDNVVVVFACVCVQILNVEIKITHSSRLSLAPHEQVRVRG